MTQTYKMVPSDVWEKIDDLLLEAYSVQVYYSEDQLEMANAAIDKMKEKLNELHVLWGDVNKAHQAFKTQGKFVEYSERPPLVIGEDE